MNIILSHDALMKLCAYKLLSGSNEFSGFGAVTKYGKTLVIEDVDLLNIGSFGYTEIPSHRQAALPLDPKRKLWFHRHPIGDGIPGTHNWSGRDNQTAEREPFGGIPELVQWSVSIVLTPRGWVGRIDAYLPKLNTIHVEVTPQPTPQDYEMAKKLITPELEAYADELKKEFETMYGKDLDEEVFYSEGPKRMTPKRKKKEKKTGVQKLLIEGKNIFRQWRERL